MKKYFMFFSVLSVILVIVTNYAINSSTRDTPNTETSTYSKINQDQNTAHKNAPPKNENTIKDSITVSLMLHEAKERTSSVVGFENSILMTLDEFHEYQQWQDENGLLAHTLKNSDYASYNKGTLYALARQGDRKAYEMLRFKPSSEKIAGESELLNRLGLVLGSGSGAYGLSKEMSRNAEDAYKNEDYEAYRTYFLEKLALLKITQLTGLTLPPNGINKVLTEYKLDDLEELQNDTQLRVQKLYEEINTIRHQQGWPDLEETEVPDIVNRYNNGNY